MLDSSLAGFRPLLVLSHTKPAAPIRDPPRIPKVCVWL